ncbi:MAG: hypothetical protein EOO87_20070 [Pedobacter sp.]|nr:MAG: hypothetical protein EOO87_20070 [Pedobacter sp.]
MVYKISFISALVALLYFNQFDSSVTTQKDSVVLKHRLLDLNKNSRTSTENGFNLFRIVPMDDNDSKAFISISDIYPDTVAVPSLYVKNQKNIPFDKLKYFELETAYRKKLLNGTGIKETDTVFMYDYKFNELAKIPVGNLKAVAHLTPYAHKGRQISIWDYMLGFEVKNDVLKKSALQYYNNVLVYIGNKNPFMQGKMYLVKWQKIEKKLFPFQQKNKVDNNSASNYYTFKNDKFIYYIRDILVDGRIEKRHFVAINAITKNILVERKFANSEGSSLAPLNFTDENQENQWSGYLFKNKPPVIFGFEYHSFGCPAITILNKSYAEIPIKCDNRH